MVIKKRKKITRQRGSKTHGWGAMKKHRGAGNRGGRGLAGTGRKADAKKPSIWKNKKYFGRHGFKKRSIKRVKAVNIIFIEENLGKLLKDKKIKEENGVYSINLSDIGFNKLLGKGKITKKFKISCQCASKKAVEAVKKMGMTGKQLFNPYTTIEWEPAFPLVNVDSDKISKVFFTKTSSPEDAFLKFSGHNTELFPQGVIGNAQTTCLQLANIYLFSHFARGGTKETIDLQGFAEKLIPDWENGEFIILS